VFELSDQAWITIQPLLPANSRWGKPWRDHRQVLGGIVWKLHTGRPWRDVPARFGPWQTCYGRLRRWQRDGTWQRLWAVLDDRGRGDGDAEVGSGADRGHLQASAPVVVAGAGLMAATPPRPPQHLPHPGRRPPHQAQQQPAHLRHRQPAQVRPWRSWEFCAFSRPPGRHPWRARPPGRARPRGPPPGTPAPPSPG
jgi:transposase